MNLHARNVAIRAGVPTDLINDCVSFMKVRNRINEKSAEMYLASHQVFERSKARSKRRGPLSSFYVELRPSHLSEPLILTVLLESKSMGAKHVSIIKEPMPAQEAEIVHKLLGGNKSYEWLENTMSLVHGVRYQARNHQTTPYLLQTQSRLKLLTILINLLVSRLSRLESKTAYDFVEDLS
jgi:hypothetical protein